MPDWPYQMRGRSAGVRAAHLAQRFSETCDLCMGAMPHPLLLKASSMPILVPTKFKVRECNREHCIFNQHIISIG